MAMDQTTPNRPRAGRCIAPDDQVEHIDLQRGHQPVEGAQEQQHQQSDLEIDLVIEEFIIESAGQQRLEHPGTIEGRGWGSG